MLYKVWYIKEWRNKQFLTQIVHFLEIRGVPLATELDIEYIATKFEQE
jgi:hypothetical protein